MTSFLWQPSFETDYALGHDFNGDTITKQRFHAEYAAGSMETTVVRLFQVFSCGNAGQKRLRRNLNKEMFSPQISFIPNGNLMSRSTDSTSDNNAIHLSYGLGWGLFTSPYGKAFFKEGHGVGWVNYVIAFPDKKMAVVIFCNDAKGESIFKELVERTAGVTIPWYWENYTPYRGSVKLPASVLQQFTGEI